ncbi:MAG TPA: DNA adenine methylase [Methanobacteriaceae archaeon]|nr:DNA adenine methylase [Methanobacteriaceae archaeon]
MTLKNSQSTEARPFLKWVGGKTQIIGELESRLPIHIQKSRVIERYVEPFLGGGALFFYLNANYQIKQSLIMDANPELIMAYQVIQQDPYHLVDILSEIETNHLEKSGEDRKSNYYQIRDVYNHQMRELDYGNYSSEWIQKTAYLIFLNKTGYNGLYRLNSSGGFNVPFGRYKNPTICDEVNLKLVHQALQKTKILCADFTLAQDFIEKETLVYMDPPYRPLNTTSHFTDYSAGGFGEDDQKRLAQFYQDMNTRGSHLILSNSDPKNEDPDDEFFDELYRDYNIERVPAKRNINSDINGRGKINELIIRNYF